jgi:excisionase family DNA binding protein
MTAIESTPGQREDRLVYSVPEAAALLGISRAFAYELVARGELPVICLGRRRLVPRAALREFVEAGSIRIRGLGPGHARIALPAQDGDS